MSCSGDVDQSKPRCGEKEGKSRGKRLKWEKSLLTPIRNRLIGPPAEASWRADRWILLWSICPLVLRQQEISNLFPSELQAGWLTAERAAPKASDHVCPTEASQLKWKEGNGNDESDERFEILDCRLLLKLFPFSSSFCIWLIVTRHKTRGRRCSSKSNTFSKVGWQNNDRWRN